VTQGYLDENLARDLQHNVMQRRISEPHINLHRKGGVAVHIMSLDGVIRVGLDKQRACPLLAQSLLNRCVPRLVITLSASVGPSLSGESGRQERRY
jgi:hypothetical protein